ncbi:DUF6103 family protein [Scatolibacter rhodanostii]|uniref:DUF6103 family protein n=1 Tax=Scatolibacter rhodanostii TaxID=2014781 RepID=UPI000C086A38|nr:DUF6103 family protein [Scatolibacter rhodanostii]
MASKSNGKLNLSFPDEKMKVLEFCLTEKGKDLDELLTEFLDGLYRKNVPVIMRKYIEPDKKKEDKENENPSGRKEISNENASVSGPY